MARMYDCRKTKPVLKTMLERYGDVAAA